MSYNQESYKRSLILKYLIPVLTPNRSATPEEIEDIINKFGLKVMIKYEEIESPGPANEGCMFFSISGIVHNYQYFSSTSRLHGTSIWNRRTLIFNGTSLITKSPRTEFIQILEQSEVLYITYPNLKYLIDKYKDIYDTINMQLINQGVYHLKKTIRFGLNSTEWVRKFRAENAAFIDCANQAIQAMHAGISLRSYTSQLKKLRENSSSSNQQ